MTKMIGIEVEFFATKEGKIVNCQKIGVPHDEYPLLAEARGKPFSCPFEAVASVRGEIEKMIFDMRSKAHEPSFVNWVKKDDHVEALHEDILRAGLGKRIAWRNIHGKSTSRMNKTHLSAGMHISFTDYDEFTYPEIVSRTVDDKVVRWTENRSRKYNQMFDFCRLFRALEVEFGKDIDDSKRTRGFYELKPDGRIEYRSLPCTLIMDVNLAARLAKVINQSK